MGSPPPHIASMTFRIAWSKDLTLALIISITPSSIILPLFVLVVAATVLLMLSIPKSQITFSLILIVLIMVIL